MTLSFAHPWSLLLLLALPALAWLKGRPGPQAAFLYSSVQLVKGLTAPAHTRAGRILRRLRWLVLALLIVAMARPRLGQGEARISASGIDIVCCIDLSRSMEAEDFRDEIGRQTNRVYVAKSVLKKFVEQRPSDRIGLVAFAGRAYVASPLTLDHEFLLANLDRLGFDGIEEGTAIGSALIAALNRLSELKSKSKIIILLTDGQSNMGKVPPLTAAEAAQAMGVKVYTVGIGTHGTAPWPRKDAFGRRVYLQLPVDIDEDALKEIAQKTNGRYYRATTFDALKSIYAEIDRLEKTTVEVKKYQRFRELMQWPIAAGLAVLLLELALAHTIWRKLP
ncbi:MAG: VWA domain-containing protein [Verrucomicrobia bacterium]|nr:VWA domain-containing protein [Verrucomicrobiota bacterium]